MDEHIHKAGGILIRNKKLLVEKSVNKDFFIAPGGKVKHGETPEQALIRELKEEFGIKVDMKDLEKFGSFTAKAAGQENRTVLMDCYLVKSWKGEPTPNREVEKILWIDTNIPSDIKVGSIFEHEVIPKLKEKNMID